PCTTYSVHFLSTPTSTTALYTLSLHDALPIFVDPRWNFSAAVVYDNRLLLSRRLFEREPQRVSSILLHELSHLHLGQRLGHYSRSEEHTSELQSRENLVCRLLLEKKKKESTK